MNKFFSAAAVMSTLLALPTAYADINIAQSPIFVSAAVPPLNMLVMGRDHKLYYEAYNDASDLNGDGVLDIGYKGYLAAANGGIDYYGYFNSKVCYSHDGTKFTPQVLGTGTNGKQCSNQWSGDFLNYLATSRMDALRKVLYGGFRSTDTATSTVLQASFIPQDAHSWGKEYRSVAYDGYDISNYAPLPLPSNGYYHLFAVTSTADNTAPLLRVLNNTTFRIWNWVSKERPVAGTQCVNSTRATVNCTTGGPAAGWTEVPAVNLSAMRITTWRDNISSPNTETEMNNLFSAANRTQCGTGTNVTVFKSGNNNNSNNPFAGENRCNHDNYHTLIEGTLTAPETGTYRFAVDGDDAVDVAIGGTVIASWYGGHGANSSAASLDLHSGTVYLTAGQTYTVRFRHEEGSGGDSWNLFWKLPSGGEASVLRDFSIRVDACPSTESLRESNCRAYPGSSSGTSYKPTGILHDYGQTNRMYFGLLSGSYAKNISGGTLRSNIQSFANELDLTTGVFRADVSGIVDTINKFRTVDFNYGNFQYGCGFITNRAMRGSDTCYMWGNPIGEMMYETMRYFSGATTPTSIYDYTTGPDVTLGLPKPTWTPPYAAETNGRGAYPSCAVPAMTVISDINPSYDYKMPGGNATWQTEDGGAAIDGSGNPASIRNFNASTEVDAIWTAEGGGSRNVFIGEAGGVSDGAPTAKTVTNLSTVRGLAPEEPTKKGTYYSAGVSRFGATNNIGGDKKLLTYSVALASPLPKIEFPVGNNVISVVPFAKSVQNSAFQPTNQIVDFYIEQIANTDDFNQDDGINNGRPFAKFRINYEDVEQGADHDMDAIAVYTLSVNNAGTLDIRLDSEYAAGGATQNMGYIISGTSKDGIYLEICDLADGSTTACANTNTYYRLNTPPGRDPGYCENRANGTAARTECSSLPITTTRTFQAADTASASLLQDPLWYAAKYGTTATAWDADNNGVPDNYFLVTNALTLRAQLDKAFGDLSQRNTAITRPAANREPISGSTSTTQAIYRTEFQVEDWSGELIKETYSSSGVATEIWRASRQIPSSRTIKINSNATTGSRLTDFTYDNLANRTFDGVGLQASLNVNPITGTTDTYGRARTAFVRGDSCSTLEGCSTLRVRDSKLGDIIGSSPVLVAGAQYLNYVADSIDGSAGTYAAFKTQQAARRGQVYVGANDGMLHAFDSTTGAERFAFVPTPVITHLNQLSRSDYTSQSNDNHRYYVDGSLTATDVYFSGAWHTVLIGTLGAGGRGVFALDVTDPDNVTLLWEFTSDTAASKTCDEANNCLSDLGYSIPTPVTARLHNGKWGVVLPNGYNSANNNSGKAVLFVLDVETGAVVKKLDAQGAATTNGLSTPRLADGNGDGVADYAYAGDLQGNLWRFDLIANTVDSDNPFSRATDGTSVANDFRVAFDGTPLYRALTADTGGSRQSITSAPSLISHPSRVGYIVAFGTGRYLGVTDKVSPYEMQTLYGIWDRQTMGQAASSTPTLNRASLQRQSITQETLNASFGSETRNVRILSNNSINWYSSSNTTGKYGWYLDLSTSSTSTGERIVDDMIKRGEVLFVGTRTPNSDPCASGVDGRYYGINPSTGGRTLFNVFDMNGDGKVDANDSFNGIPVSSLDSPGTGGFIITDGNAGPEGNPNLRGPDGEGLAISLGGGSTGRQSWRVIPENIEP